MKKKKNGAKRRAFWNRSDVLQAMSGCAFSFVIFSPSGSRILPSSPISSHWSCGRASIAPYD